MRIIPGTESLMTLPTGETFITGLKPGKHVSKRVQLSRYDTRQEAEDALSEIKAS